MRPTALRWISAISLLLIFSISSIVSCRTPSAPNPVEVDASVNCRRPADKCIAVSRAFVDEHARLFDQVIRLKAALKICEKRI